MYCQKFIKKTFGTTLAKTGFGFVSSLILFAIPLSPTFAQVAPNARPTGGSVVAGSASISQTPTQTTVTQSSQSAVVNWQSFNVGSQQTVDFVQPGVSSAILNRVLSPDPSSIAGRITANGQVYIVNQSGIAFLQGSQVNVGGGFVASSIDISPANFMAGSRTFDRPGNPNARVDNQGTITVGRGGYAALISGTVANSGVIDVPVGKVGLGAGTAATLDFSGDGFLQVTAPVRQTPIGPDGKPVTALINNTGTIKSNGGRVLITAAAAQGIVQSAVNVGGKVQAHSISGHNGSIVIGSTGGAVNVVGKVSTKSKEGVGGNIQITGPSIQLTGATLNASGATGGGVIKVGGNRHGAGPLPNAATTTVDANSTIKADAIQSGDGGKITLWSDQATTFAGTMSAKGGAASGDGGSAEIGSGGTNSLTGSVDLSAPNGKQGKLLLD